MSLPIRRWPACLAVCLGFVVAGVMAQSTPRDLDEHTRRDIERHRAMAAAHTAAAQCLESGRKEADCHKDLQAACKGIAVGKYCGMRH